MAKVTRRTVGEDVDRLLEMGLYHWTRLPEVEREIGGWPLIDQLDFVVELPLEETRLDRLRAHAERGEMAEGQRARYEELLRLVDANRPIAERLGRS